MQGEQAAQRAGGARAVFTGDAEVVEGERAHHGPADVAACHALHRTGGAAQGIDATGRTAAVERPGARGAGQQGGQVPVGDQRGQRQLADVLAVGGVVRIHQRNKNLLPDVARARPLQTLAGRQQARLAPNRVEGAVVAGCVVKARVKRQERLLGHLAGAVAGDRVQGVDLEVHRSRAIGNHVVFPRARPELNAIQPFGKQIDGRGAKQRQAARIDQRLEGRVAARQQQYDLGLAARGQGQPARQVGDLEEQQALRHRRVFLQQAVAAETAQRLGQRSLFIVEAELPHRGAAGKALGRTAPRASRTGAADPAAQAGTEQQFVDSKGNVVGRGHVKGQPVHRQLAELQPAMRLEAYAQAAPHRPVQRKARQRQIGGVAEILHRLDLDRPQRHGMGGAEFAARVLATHGLAGQRTVARHGETARQVRVHRVGPHARDQHRWHRRQKAGIDRFQQVLDQARMLGVDLQLHARGHERKTFEQALDVGVGHLHAVHRQARRDLRELLRKLRPHLAQMRELVAVQAQQARVHQGLRRGGPPAMSRT